MPPGSDLRAHPCGSQVRLRAALVDAADVDADRTVGRGPPSRHRARGRRRAGVEPVAAVDRLGGSGPESARRPTGPRRRGPRGDQRNALNARATSRRSRDHVAVTRTPAEVKLADEPGVRSSAPEAPTNPCCPGTQRRDQDRAGASDGVGRAALIRDSGCRDRSRAGQSARMSAAGAPGHRPAIRREPRSGSRETRPSRAMARPEARGAAASSSALASRPIQITRRVVAWRLM